ncbi:hypothetical protein K435DRAFT_471886 [Dendrothele bispora CBS 962.96]|uniref:Uncharacterized protein n=1 Tax=Dendrothele bispora (strain CBS 962.96) TaxID=1314807 RepID=A0A4S8KZI5_DENBC|nr:hypothetical protein K435DRAFT_471886 [Dendrothele bispora CBS 962.96]
MVRRHIAVEVKRLVLRMTMQDDYDPKDVQKKTGVSRRIQYRIRKLFKDRGVVVNVPSQNGRPMFGGCGEYIFANEGMEDAPTVGPLI